MAGRKGEDMDGLGGSVGWGGAQTSSDSICWSAKVPPVGVVFHPECHPSHRGGVPNSQGCPAKLLHTGPFSGGQCRYTNTGNQLPDSQ